MKLWGGRFSQQPDEAADRFHSSISFDWRLYKYDITGSIAHAAMLGKQGIIPQKDADVIVEELKKILSDIQSGILEIDQTAEDIHTFVESALVSRIGEAGKRLHTGRSRNDQVTLDMRMFVKDEISYITGHLTQLSQTLLDTADKHTGTIMPGFTHMQKAQPVTLAHHLLAYISMFRRDIERLNDCKKRTDVMPLGSGALAATVYPVDRQAVCSGLEFDKITANSMDAVSDRDFCIEFLSCLSIIMMHLSRFCEELVLWSTDSFGFAEISDAYATGSSIMPQKKNPDMAELIRGKTGRVYGSLVTLLTVMKGLPLSYNTDMQEDKESIFDAVDTVKACLTIFNGMFKDITFNKKTMYESAQGGYITATDAADLLVKKGVAFRDAHELAGRLVCMAQEKGVTLNKLTIDDYKSISEHFDETIFDAITLEASLNARSIPGGPAENAVKEAIKEAKEFLNKI